MARHAELTFTARHDKVLSSAAEAGSNHELSLLSTFVAHDFFACGAVQRPEFAHVEVAVVHVDEQQSAISRVIDASDLVLHWPLVELLPRAQVICHDSVVGCCSSHARAVARDSDICDAEAVTILSAALRTMSLW